MSKTESQRKKEYLRQYIILKRREKELEDEIESIRSRYTGKAITYSDMPKASSNQSDLSDYAVEVDELLRTLECRQAESVRVYKSIESSIEQMQDDREKELLRLKYLLDLTWPEVADRMGYSMDSERWVRTMHDKALEHFQPCSAG